MRPVPAQKSHELESRDRWHRRRSCERLFPVNWERQPFYFRALAIRELP